MTGEKLGVIGLGAMGGPTVEHLLELGHEVAVFDADDRRVHDSVQLGAVPSASIQELAATVDRLLLFLPGPTEVMAVTSAMAEQGTRVVAVIDFTTSDPSVSITVRQGLADEGVRYVDAGVLGNPPLARSGQLLLLLGCTAEESDIHAPVLQSVSRQCFYLGRPGAGHAAKLAANELFTGQVAAMAEALILLRALDADQTVFLDALSATGGRGVGLADIGRVMLADPPAAGFALRLAAKDVRLLQDLAAGTRLSLPVASALASLFSAAAEAEPDRDYTGVYHHLLRSESGVAGS